MSARTLERQAVIAGVGQSPVGRRLGRSGLDLTIDACLSAIADAGLDPSDIDGIATYPGARDDMPGFSPVGVADIGDALRLKLDWYNGAAENPAQLGAVITGIAAVAAGYARHVLCFRTVTEATAQGKHGRAVVTPGLDPSTRVGRLGGYDFSWWAPFGASSATVMAALYAQHHFDVFGTAREQLAQIALVGRLHATANRRAVYRDPLTLDDYMAARMISSPLCLYDCDVPCDGSTAIIVSDRDAAGALRRPPVRIEAVGSALHGRYSWEQWEDLSAMAMHHAAAMMWSRTELTPADVDVAELYDGFSFLALAWIEALGFCGIGEGGSFVEGGHNLSANGSLPLNTHGGQLSAGRTHAFGLAYEACLQLWGEAGDHQLDNRPEVAVVSAGGGTLASCLLLVRS